MLELAGHPQHYDWGSTTAIPELLGRAADGTPWAELWFGAHPLGPATVPDGTRLDDLIASAPLEMLGEGVGRAFQERLPFLLKVISAERPLSLQVHPTREEALESFAAENAAGIPVDSPRRTFRDPNHKPELLYALTGFTALCGFRTPRRAAVIVEGLGTDLTDRLHRLLVANPTAHGMRAAFRTLVSTSMRPSEAEVAEVVAACRARSEAGSSPSPRIDAFLSLLAEHHPGDPGVVAALLLNPVTLRPGESLFIPAGALHAYLHGTGLEVMASGDNVLRAGLTSKTVHADEVLQSVSVTAAPPLRVAPERQSAASVAYYAPVDDFELAITQLSGDGAPSGRAQPVPVPGTGPRILLGLEGELVLTTASGTHPLRPGRAVFVPAADGALQAQGRGRFAQASVP